MFHIAELYTNLNTTVYLMLALLQDITINWSGVESLERIGDDCVKNLLPLSQVFLPVNLILYRQIEQSLEEISTKLQERDGSFSIAHQTPVYYFQIRRVGYTQTNTTLFISVPIPLTSDDSFFEMYKLHAFPIHTNATNPGATLITHLPEYVAISQNQEYYPVLSYSELRDCIGQTLKKMQGYESRQTQER